MYAGEVDVKDDALRRTVIALPRAQNDEAAGLHIGIDEDVYKWVTGGLRSEKKEKEECTFHLELQRVELAGGPGRALVPGIAAAKSQAVYYHTRIQRRSLAPIFSYMNIILFFSICSLFLVRCAYLSVVVFLPKGAERMRPPWSANSYVVSPSATFVQL